VERYEARLDLIQTGLLLVLWFGWDYRVVALRIWACTAGITSVPNEEEGGSKASQRNEVSARGSFVAPT